MSFNHLFRETEQMKNVIESLSAAAKVSESLKLANIIPKIDLQTSELISKQYSEALKATQTKVDLNLVMSRVDVSHITEALQNSADFSKVFQQISVSLPTEQLEFLRSISTSNVDLSSIIEQLSVEALPIGEFEREEEEDALLEESNKSEITEEVHDRLELVRFLPLKVIDAVAANPELMRGLDPRDFEKLVAELLNSLKFENIILTPRSGDGGRDVIATKFVSGIPLLFSFECKRYADKIGLDLMRGLLGSVAHGPTKANKGVLVTTSSFTKGAKDFIVSEPLVDGKDFKDLVVWLNEYKQGNQ